MYMFKLLIGYLFSIFRLDLSTCVLIVTKYYRYNINYRIDNRSKPYYIDPCIKVINKLKKRLEKEKKKWYNVFRCPPKKREEYNVNVGVRF